LRLTDSQTNMSSNNFSFASFNEPFCQTLEMDIIIVFNNIFASNLTFHTHDVIEFLQQDFDSVMYFRIDDMDQHNIPLCQFGIKLNKGHMLV